MSLIKEPDSPVELVLRQRGDGSQYIEVWVRSKAKPKVQRASIIERGFQESTAIEIAAGAIMETFWDGRSNEHDPSEIAKVAREMYQTLNLKNPRPTFGSESPIDG